MLEGLGRRMGVPGCEGNGAARGGGKKKQGKRGVGPNSNHGYTMLPPTTASFAGDS